MEIIDSGGPTRLSRRAENQVAKQEREREALEQRIRQIDGVILGIVDNDRRHCNEDEETMTARLRRYNLRQGLAQARFHITGERRKGGTANDAALKALTFIRKRWVESNAGFGGVPLRVEEIGENIGLKKRQTQKMLDRLETHKLILRFPEPGGVWRFAVTLPESDEYHNVLLNTFERRIPGLQGDAEKAVSEVQSIADKLGTCWWSASLLMEAAEQGLIEVHEAAEHGLIFAPETAELPLAA